MHRYVTAPIHGGASRLWERVAHKQLRFRRSPNLNKADFGSTLDPRIGERRRHHLGESGWQKAVRCHSSGGSRSQHPEDGQLSHVSPQLRDSSA
jgi:hypothetical protein